MFNWFKILWNLNDEKLVEINGIYYTLYLVLLRYSAVFFGGISIFNLILMVPIYLTGSPKVKLETVMDNITVEYVTNNSGKLAFTYFA